MLETDSMSISVDFSPGLLTNIFIDPIDKIEFITSNHLMSKLVEYDEFNKTYRTEKVSVCSDVDPVMGKIAITSGLVKWFLLDLIKNELVKREDIHITDSRADVDDFHLSKIDINEYEFLYNHSSDTNIQLRDYQFEGIKTLLSSYSGILSFPTSSGKGEIIVQMSRILQQFGQVLILVPSMSSLKSTQERLEDYNIKFYQYHKIRNLTEIDGVILSTPKIIYNDITKKGPDSILNNVKYLITNEVHHVQAKTWFEVSKGLPAVIRSYGFSATPDIIDSSSDISIPEMSLRESMIRGTHGDILMEVKSRDIEEFISVPKAIDVVYKSRTVKPKDNLVFDWSRVKHYVYDPERIKFVADLVHIINDYTDFTTITFVSYIETQGDPLYNLYPSSTVCWYGGGVVNNNIGLDLNKETVFGAIKNGELRHVLITSHGREDINLPVLNVAIMMDLTKRQAIKQCVGRVVRQGSPSFFVNIQDTVPKVLYVQASKRSKFISEEYGIVPTRIDSLGGVIRFFKDASKLQKN